MPMSEDLPLTDLIVDHGVRPEDFERVIAALCEGGLTRLGKQRIARSKQQRAKELLRARFTLLCSRCLASATPSPHRQVLQAARCENCERCSGSDNRIAVDRLCAAMAQRRMTRLLVVGGSPAVRVALATLVGGRLELRLVDGSERRTGTDARHDLAWADLVLVWGGTQLDHKVSSLYTGAPTGSEKVTTVRHRGITALVSECLAARGWL